MFVKTVAAVSSVLAIVSQVSAIATISAVGSKFFTSDGDQFYIKGMCSMSRFQHLKLTILKVWPTNSPTTIHSSILLNAHWMPA